MVRVQIFSVQNDLARFLCIAALVMSVGVYASPAKAQADPLHEAWRWVRYGAESGLPSDHVLDVVETDEGVAWAMTEAGLAWYDEYRWHPVRIMEGSVSRFPSHIVPDRQGGILTIAGRHLYQVDERGYTRVPLAEEADSLVVRDVVPMDDGALLLLTSGGLYRHHPSGFDAFPTPPTVDFEAMIDGHFLMGNEGIWLSTRQGVFQWTDTRWVKRFDYPARFFQTGPWGGMAAVPDGSVATYGLWTWEPGRAPTHQSGEERSLITLLFADPAGNAIVTYATGQVWTRRDGQWTQLTPVPPPLVNPHAIRSRRNGDLWVSTDQGCFLFRASSTRWSRWRDTEIDQGNHINAIVPTRDGAVWMGTGAGLFIRRPDGTRQHIAAVLSTPLRNVTGLAEDREGDLWVASGNSFAGAFRWHEGAWSRVGAEAGLDAPRIHKIVKDRRGRLWFLGLGVQGAGANMQPGAFVYDGNRFTRWSTAEGLINGRVYDFAEGPDGAYWFATAGGISRHHDGQWTHWTTREGLLENRVFTLTLDDDDRLWFGHQDAGHGLGYLDPQGRPHYLRVADGLIDNEVWSVQTGPNAALWIGTRDGLNRYRDGAFDAFGSAAGLDYRHVWPVVPMADQVYAGTIGGGLYVLHLDEQATPPPLVLVKPPLVVAGHMQFQWQVFAHHGRQPPNAIKTRHRLDDQPWSVWSTARHASALNLSAGTHTFTVQARSLFGTTDAPGTPATFRIEPPFYRRPPFLAGALLLLITIAALGVTYWRRHLRNQALMRKTEERFARVFHASPVAIAITTLDEGRVIEVNDSFSNLFGYTREEAIGHTARDLGFWQDPAQRDEMAAQIGRRESIHRKVVQFRVKSGEVRMFQGSLELIEFGGRQCLLWMGLDVTEQEQAEKALQQSQMRLEAAQTRAKLGSWEYDPATQVGYWSAEMYRLYGRDPARGNPSLGEFLDLIHPEDRERVQASQMQSLYSPDPVSLDYRTNPANGPVKHLNTTVHTVKDDEGRPIYLAGTVMDITERKKAEEERERLIGELEAKNAELEQFTYTVSHDLKSPLVTIRGFVGLLQQDAAAQDHERMQQDVDHINAATDKMQRLLGELLELSRIGRLVNPPEAVDLDTLAEEALSLVAGRLVARGVEVTVSEALPVVFGDRVRLLQVLQNLLDNAVKFMGEQRHPRIELGARVAGGEAVCWVRDNGMGIDAAYREKIFGLFERLEASGEGTGIGLALVKRIVEVHGGRVWVESEGPGQGSTFYFTLPMRMGEGRGVKGEG